MIEKYLLVNGDAASAVKEVMDHEHVNQTKLAEMCGMNRQAVQQSINRKSRNMRVTTMEKLLNAMGYELAIVRKEGGGHSSIHSMMSPG